MTASSYTWDNAMVEGRRRLSLLEGWLDPSTFRHLDAIGVRSGWRCFELGAGGGSVCERLCALVGPGGRVCAMDLDARFVRGLSYANLEVRGIRCAHWTRRRGVTCVSAFSISLNDGDRIRTGRTTYRTRWRSSDSATCVRGRRRHTSMAAPTLRSSGKISWGHVRDGVAAAGSDVSQWDRELATLNDPSLIFVGPMTVAVIATKPNE